MTPKGEMWRRAAVVTVGTTTVVILAVATVMLLPVRPPEPPAPPPLTIEAGVLELPLPSTASPAPPQAESPSPPSPVEPPRPRAPEPAAKPKPPKPHAPAKAVSPPRQESPAPTEAAPAPAPPAEPSQKEGLPGGTGAARAIFQPSPIIPPELRRHALSVVAVVRFTIAPDGCASAELEDSTPDPQFNQVLLDTFRRWRLFPAMQEGKPIASTLVLRVPIRVE